MRRRTCACCLAERDEHSLFHDDDGSWYCRDVVACLEACAGLPDWLSV